jgi:hypothetical protein
MCRWAYGVLANITIVPASRIIIAPSPARITVLRGVAMLERMGCGVQDVLLQVRPHETFITPFIAT